MRRTAWRLYGALAMTSVVAVLAASAQTTAPAVGTQRARRLAGGPVANAPTVRNRSRVHKNRRIPPPEKYSA